MREDWKYQPLGEITTSINGLWKGKKPPFVNVGVIRNANFTQEFTLNLSNIEYLDVEERQYSSRKLQRGDLIVEKSGGSEKQPVGRTILFDLEGEYSVSNFTSILRIKDKTSILPTFLYKYLLYIYKEGYTKEMQNATTGIHNIIYDKFLSIPIPILSLSEQERIVALLDDQFAKIDALKANADQQLQAAKDLFQAALKQVFVTKENWKYLPLGEICDILDSKRKPITKNKRLSGSIPYYGATGVLDYVKDYIFNEKLVLLGEDGAKWGAGENSAYIIDGKSWVNNHAHALRPHRNIIVDEFIVYYLNFTDLSDSITGVTVPKLNQEKMRAISIPVPPLPEQERIAARLDAISEKVKALQANYDQTINLCNDLKQALLKSIFA